MFSANVDLEKVAISTESVVVKQEQEKGHGNVYKPSMGTVVVCSQLNVSRTTLLLQARTVKLEFGA